jgi:hypothetical protein
VLLRNDETPRMEWSLARVIESVSDDDGLVRRVKIQVGTSELDKKGKRVKKLSILERPIQKLVLLLEHN